MMKTSVIEVHDMLSVWNVDEAEKRIGEVPGVESVTVNFAAGSATVRYDETRLEVADIKSAVRQRGYESAAPADSAGDGHEDRAARDSRTPCAETFPGRAGRRTRAHARCVEISPGRRYGCARG
jgi:copper chaperone CopZ